MTLIDRARRHLAKNNMSYWQHFAFAGGHGLRCLRAAACLVIHAIAPCWYRRAGSRLVHRLEQDFKEHRGGVEISEWTPVSERLPDRYWDGFSQIVVVTAGNAYSVGRYYKCPLDDEGHESDTDIGGRWYIEATMPVTHWMPLPEPPRCEGC